VRGKSASVSLDGRLAYRGAVATSPTGRVGFRAIESDHFLVGHLVVASPDGARLLADDFATTNPPALACDRWEPIVHEPRAWAPPPCLVAPHDGAKRDRALAAADLVIADRATWATSGAYRFGYDALAFASPAPLAGPRMLADYPAWWVWGVRDYLWWSGDRAGAQTLYPAVVATLDSMASLLSPRHLVEHPAGWRYVDWYWSASGRHGESSYESSLWVLALERGAELADALGRPPDAGRWRALAGEIRAAIRPRLWDGQVGALVDSSEHRDLHPPDANALGVLAHAVTGDDAASALRYVQRTLWSAAGTRTAEGDYPSEFHDRTIWPAYVTYELLARQSLGDGAGADEALRRTWGNMLDRGPQSTAWELAGADGPVAAGEDSLAHGWSTGAIWGLTSGTLGVEPTAPGFAHFAVLPLPGDLPWARGRVPSPAGPIDVAWSNAPDEFRLLLTVPPNTTARAGVPTDGRSTIVYVGPQLAWDGKDAIAAGARVQDRWVTVELGPGSHQVRGLHGPVRAAAGP
jgi:hypothetical protein